MFPLLLSSLALVLRALDSNLFEVSLVAALLSIGVGLALRKQKRAAIVVFSMFSTAAFATLIIMGILVPLTWFTLNGRSDWVALVAAINGAALAIFTGVRARRAMRTEFGGALEDAPGVSIGSEGIFRHELVSREEPLLGPIAWLGIAVFVPAVLLYYGSRSYLLIVLVVSPIFCALLCVDAVARVLALFIAIRRWERAQGKRLYLLPL
jgi:hypothetical protein